MQRDKVSLGELLKEKRQEKKLSLQDAENGTSIRTSYLQAIEENQVEYLISPVYIQGFIRQYSSFLGLDVEELQRSHPEAFAPSTRGQEFSYGIGTLEMRGSPGAGVKWLPNFAWVAAFGLVIVIAWVLARYLEVI